MEKSELTVNYKSLMKKIVAVDSSKLRTYYTEKYGDENEIFIMRSCEREQLFMDEVITDTRELRNFISDTFGIGMEAGLHSHHRNVLNRVVKKYVNTEKRRLTKITMLQYKQIVTDNEFIDFIITNMQSDFKIEGEDNIKKMYSEIESLLVYRREWGNFDFEINSSIEAIKNVFLLLEPKLINKIRKLYCNNEYFKLYGSYPDNIDDIEEYLTKIVRYRDLQEILEYYKFESIGDVMSTNEDQLTKWFIRDIILWDNDTIYKKKY